MTTKITTDWHLGVKRGAGTTPASQEALKQYLRDTLQEQLDDTDHLICGDLFNDFTVETSEVIAAYEIFNAWLAKYGKKLALVRGNHDYHESGGKVSSFDLLGAILLSQYPDQVTVATDVVEWKQFVLVPHLPNNDILQMEVEKLAGIREKILVFHANVDNAFTAESLHSLNLTSDQVGVLTSQDSKVICGHEHQHRSLLGGKCLILGNGAPSSVADCLGNSTKLHAIAEGLEITLHHHIDLAPVFIDIPWTQLEQDLDQYKFIRVSGDCTADQAASMVSAISKLRQKSKAFVISSAVRVEGMTQMEGLAEMSVESISKFNVLGALLEELNEREQKTVKELLS